VIKITRTIVLYIANRRVMKQQSPLRRNQDSIDWRLYCFPTSSLACYHPSAAISGRWEL